MSVKTTLMGVAAATALLIGSAAMADEPVKLTDGQMDDVTAGFAIAFGGTGGFGTEFLGLAVLADLKEESSAETSESESLSFGPGPSASGSYSATTKAKASIKGNFAIIGGGAAMYSGGTLAIGASGQGGGVI